MEGEIMKYKLVGETFKSIEDKAWQKKDLKPYGVQPNEVCEIIMKNESEYEQQAGVRLAGSNIQRIVTLAPAGEKGDTIKIHADTDEEGRIEFYGESQNVVFFLDGWWTAESDLFIVQKHFFKKE